MKIPTFKIDLFCVLLLIILGLAFGACNTNNSSANGKSKKRSAVVSNDAFSIDKLGKLILKKDFELKKVNSKRIVVYNSKKWIVTQNEGQWTTTNVNEFDCDPPCSEGHLCINRVCLPIANSCDNGCPEGTICNKGYCVPLSNCTPPCEEGEYCHMGFCMPNVGSENICDPECKKDEACICYIGQGCKCIAKPVDILAENITILN